MAEKLIHPKLSYKINGILFDVQNELGQFCNEQQYCDSIEAHLKSENIKYQREKVLPLSFESELPGRNKVDFFIEGFDGEIILEVKAKKIITKDDYYQIKRYLTAFNKKLGILVNFRSRYITPKRILNSASG